MQLEDMVWDSIQGSDDYNMPEREENFSGSAWSSGDRRKKLCRRFSKPSRKHAGLAAQRSLRTRVILKISKENLYEESGAKVSSEDLPQPRPAGKPAMWNDLTNGAAVSKSTSSQQLATSNQLATLSGRESMSAREDVKVEPSVLGSDDLKVYMPDPLYAEDDASIETTTCHFTLGDVDPEESGLPLFGNVSDEGKIDYTWDNCFGNLENVDNLLSSGPENDFGPINSNSDGLQWHESASPPGLQPDNHISRVISPPGTDCGSKGNVDVLDMKMEFVPVDVALPSPAVEKEKGLSLRLKDPELSSPASKFGSNLQNSQQPKQQQQPQPAQQPAMRLDARDGLHNVKSQAGQADRHLASKRMEITVNCPESSSLCPSDSEKASMAQAHRARRHAVNRKRCEERTKRQLTQRKTVNGVPYGSPQVPQLLQSIPLQLSSPAHLHQSSSPNLHAYQATPSPLSPLQPLVQPTSPFRHGRYVPPMHLMPTVAPPSVPPQMQAQGVYLGYQQQPGAFSQPMPHHPRHPLGPLGETPIGPATSGTAMTPQEKIEKLHFLQQMQARLAVEQQQQQFASQGVAFMDSRVPCKGQAQLPQRLSICLPDVAVTSSDLGRAAASDSDFEQSLSVGQTSAEASSDDEGGSLEAGVLEQLQNSMKTLEGGTKLCIRDALYRLARSAMKRQASSGERAIGGEAGSSSSEDADATSTGLEGSINSDPSSSSRVSRMNVNMVETQTNPIDRSIAHLLFYKSPRQPGPAPAPAPAPGSGPGPVQGPYTPVNDARLAATQTCVAGPSNSPPLWQQGNLAQGNWAGAQMNPIGGAIPKMAVGVEIGPVPLLCAPMSYDPRLASTSVSRLQAGTNPDVGCQALEQQTATLSPLVPDSSLTGGHLQGNNVGNAMLVGDLPSPGGSQLCGGTVKETRYTHAQVLPSTGHREAYEGRSNLRNKRLQHAGGLGELSQLLTEGLAVGSEASPMGKGESGVASGPPGSQSSGSVEIRAGSLLKKSNVVAEREIQGERSEQGQFCPQEEGLRSC